LRKSESLSIRPLEGSSSDDNSSDSLHIPSRKSEKYEKSGNKKGWLSKERRREVTRQRLLFEKVVMGRAAFLYPSLRSGGNIDNQKGSKVALFIARWGATLGSEARASGSQWCRDHGSPNWATGVYWWRSIADRVLIYWPVSVAHGSMTDMRSLLCFGTAESILAY